MNIKQSIAVSASGLIFNPDTGESFTVNPMGAEIVNHLKTGLTKENIVDEVTKKYSVEAAAFEQDLMDFIGVLRNHLLIEDAE